MRLYLDHNASTPIASVVARAMQPFLESSFGNPSSGHWASVDAARAVEVARESVARLLGATPDEIYFTSGGSESNNWALKGVVAHAQRVRKIAAPHLVISAVEHPSVRKPSAYLSAWGARTTIVPVDGHGLVDPADIRKAIEPSTVLVSVMHANNEVGTVEPVAEIAEVAHACGVHFHSDAAQSVGKIAVNVDAMGVDLLTVAGHKLYAPKGVGVLYVRAGIPLDPLIEGGGHERGQRAGTENVLLAVGLGAAAELALAEPHEVRLRELGTYFWDGLRSAFGERVKLLGHPERRLPNTLNVSFQGRIGAEILAAIPELAASTGSACDAGKHTLSSVLTSMGVSNESGRGAIRFSLGRETTQTEVDHVLELLRAQL